MNFREEHHRRSIRLPEYDYSRPGAYYVTLCTRQKVPLLGVVSEGAMVLSPYGQIVEEEWQGSAQIRSEIQLDAYVIMPNHMHAVAFITRQVVSSPVPRVQACGRSCMGDQPVAPTKAGSAPLSHVGATGWSPMFGERPRGPGRKSLAALLAGFKTASTKRVNRLRGTPSLPIWQRNYYERIIRDEGELNRIREYILENPMRWHYDRENPEAVEHVDEDPWT